MVNKIEAKQELAKRKAKSNFWSFCLYMLPEFYKVREYPLKEIAEALEWAYREGKKLAISTPPRTGKSTIANHFSAWVLLQSVEESVFRSSYSDELTTSLNRQVVLVMESPKYKDLKNYKFVVNNDGIRQLEGAHRPNLLTTSVGGSVTGFGANVLIADDIYKDSVEAFSEAINRKTIMWYESAWETRLDGDIQTEIVIGTRWRVGELVDIREKQGYFDKVIKIKALQNGKSFNEKIHTTKNLLLKQSVMNNKIFNAVYQQEPIEFLNQLIKKSSLTFISDYVPTSAKIRLMVVDIADEGKDRTTAIVLDVYKDKVVCIGTLTINERLEIAKPKIMGMAIDYKVNYFMIESNHNSYFARLICEELPNYIIANTFPTTQNKEAKIVLNSYQIARIQFLETEDEDYNEFVDRMCRYDTSLKNQHDDEIDVAAMAINFVNEIRGEEIE